MNEHVENANAKTGEKRRCRSGLVFLFLKRQAVLLLAVLAVVLSGCGLLPGKTQDTEADPNVSQPSETSEENANVVRAPDFTLTDQNGLSHQLSQYKGKVVFLNFWATWCPPCQRELPDVDELYMDHGENTGDVVVLGMVFPAKEGESSAEGQKEMTVEGIRNFLKEKGFHFPVLMDTTGSLFRKFGIDSLPTTFFIDKNGNVVGYAPAAMSRELMDSLVQKTLDGIQ